MSAQQVYEAVHRGDLDAVRRMVEANASLKEEPYNDWTPLQLAAMYGQVGIVRYLVGEAGADKDEGDMFRRTPLYWAALFGRLEAVRYLVGVAGADKDKAKRGGWTPLMSAAIDGHIDMVRCLLEAGADATLKNRYGKTAITLAEEKNHAKVADALREYLPGGLMYRRRDAVQTSVLNQKDLGPDVARFCGDFVIIT